MAAPWHLCAVTIAAVRRERPLAPAYHVVTKVPQVTVSFWVIKVLSTGMGEATSDYLAHRIAPVIAVLLGGTGLTVAMALQFRARRYVICVYWAAVVMVSVFGTIVADGLHVKMGINWQGHGGSFGAIFTKTRPPPDAIGPPARVVAHCSPGGATCKTRMGAKPRPRPYSPAGPDLRSCAARPCR